MSSLFDDLATSIRSAGQRASGTTAAVAASRAGARAILGQKAKKKPKPPTKKPPGTTVSPAPPQQPTIYDAQIERQRAMEKQDLDQLSGYNLARARILQGLAPQVSDIYGKAANAVAGYGGGFSDAVRQRLSDTGAAAEGATGRQAGSEFASGIQAGYNPGLTSDLTRYLGAYLPGENLQTQGAAFGAAAAFEPTRALGEGQYALTGRMRQAQNDIADIQAQEQSAAAKGITTSKINASASKLVGYLVDETGSPILNSKGKPIPVNSDAQLTAYQRAQLAATGTRLDLQAKGLDLRAQSLELSSAKADRQYQLQVAKWQSQGKEVDVSASKLLGHVVFNDGTVPRQKNGHVFSIKTPPKPPRGLTQSQINKARGLALTIAQHTHDGFTDAKGVQHPPLSYTDALLEMEKSGVPENIARKQLNRYYAKGDRGRPAFDPAEIRRYAKLGWPTDVLTDALSNPLIANRIRRARRPSQQDIAWARTITQAGTT